MEKTHTLADLRHFIGSETWYRHGLVRHILYTDGVHYVAEQGGAYWLLDEIVLAQKASCEVAGESFQLWTLEVRKDRTALLTCDGGHGNPIFRKQIDYTDFPLDSIQLYLTNNTILLPSEY